MKNKKSIIILAALIALWGISFIFSNTGAKKESKSEKYVYKKKTTNNSVEEEVKKDIFESIRVRTSLKNENKRDLFAKDSSIPPQEIKNLSADEERIKNEKKAEKEKKKKEKKQVVQLVVQPVVNNFVPPPQAEPSEEEKITNELYGIEIQGSYKNGKSTVVFIQYGGMTQEISDEGSVTINTGKRSYEVKITVLGDGDILFHERSRNIMIKKKIKG